MNENLTPSDDCVALVKRSEGLRLNVYKDDVGKLTVGYGHLLTAGEIAGATYSGGVTEDQAEEILQRDLATAAAGVRAQVQVELRQGQFDALVDFVFNLGQQRLAGSTLLKFLNGGDYGAVPSELRKWNKGTVRGQLVELPGLTARRLAEVGLWQR